jgi:hypothetical protein
LADDKKKRGGADRALIALGESYEVVNVGSGQRSNSVIARSEATKQSILSFRGKMDCFAESVIGRAFAGPGGS